MPDTLQITDTAEQLTAMIRVTIPRAEIRKVMGPGISEVRAVIAAQGIAATGPWFAHHLRMDPGIFDFEICVPIAAPILPAGRVEAGRIKACKVVRTVYEGPYEGLGAAWREFDDWIAANGLATGPDLSECYLIGPESSPDPAKWRTELSRQLVD